MDTRYQLYQLEILARVGIEEIGRIGYKIHHTLRSLETAEFLPDEVRSSTNFFRERLRELTRAHKDYRIVNASIATNPLEERIATLTPTFNGIKQYAENLYNEVSNFVEYHFQTAGSTTTADVSQSETGEAEGSSTIVNLSQAETGEIVGSSTIVNVSQSETGEAEGSNTIVNLSQAETGEAVGSSTIAELLLAEAKEDLSSSVALNTDYFSNRNIICQISIPLRINKIYNLQSGVSLPSWLTLEPEFQLQYLQNINGSTKFFIGMNCNLSFNGCNLKNPTYDKSRLLSVRSFNTLGKVYRTHNNSEFTLSLGHIVIVNKKEIVVSTNLPFISTQFQKQNVSFQLECRNMPNIVTSKNRFYSTFQPTISFEFFPFLNSFPLNFVNFSKKKTDLTETLNNQTLLSHQPGNESSNCRFTTISVDNPSFQHDDSWLNDDRCETFSNSAETADIRWLNDDRCETFSNSAETADIRSSFRQPETLQRIVGVATPNYGIQTSDTSSKPGLAGALFLAGITLGAILAIRTWMRNGRSRNGRLEKRDN
jgi:hypothetical protein